MAAHPKESAQSNNPQRGTATRMPLSRRKRVLFAIVALLLAPAFLFGLELVLRLSGYGGTTAVIRETGQRDGRTVVITDSMGAATYFYANRSKPGAIFETTFYKQKPAGLTRIMLLGESAAKGYPQPPALASSAFLQTMLSDLWPERTVEVLNFACTAVASFPIRGILSEAIEYEPDLVIVYCGNNEFFGSYGVASLHSAGDSVTAMRFQRWYRGLALAQFIDRFAVPAESGSDKALMERMIGQSYIGPADRKRESAARNIYENVSAMIEMCSARGVPVIVCSSPVNERDLAPLGDDDLSSLPPGQRAELMAALNSAPARIKSEPSAVLEQLRTFDDTSAKSARLRFLTGKALQALKRFPEASAAFREAVDLDPMPWRATGSINDSIERAARDNGAIFCDLAGAFRNASPGGSVGWELMDDHVHPSLQGQDLIARTIVRTLTSAPGRLAVDRARADALPNWETLASRLGDNEYERYGVAHTIQVLANISFMRKTNPEMFDRFSNLVRKFETTMDTNVRKAAIDWQKPETHRGGTQRPISGMVARVRIKQGRFEEAAKLSDFAARCLPPYSSWSLEFTYFKLVSRQRVKARLNEADRKEAQDGIERGRFLLSHGYVGTGLTERYIGRLHQLREEWPEAIPYLLHARRKLEGQEQFAADQALIESYLRTGNLDAARKIIETGELSPELGRQYAQLRQAYLGGSRPAAPTSP